MTVRTTSFLLLILCSAVPTSADDWYDRKTDWHGFERLHFTCAGRNAYIVEPKKEAPGRPWVWRARFPDFHFEMDVELLRRGFHIGYIDVAGMFGSSKAMSIGERFYQFMTVDRRFSKQPAMEGVGRGGLFV